MVKGMIIKEILKKLPFGRTVISYIRKKLDKMYHRKNLKILENAGEKAPMEELERRANRYRVLKYYERNVGEAEKYQQELSFLKDAYPDSMRCTTAWQEFKGNFKQEIETISYDADREMYYGIRNGRKMYFKKSMSKASAISYFMGVCYEQSEKSAHRYLDDDFTVEAGSIVLDLGAAEGIFGLDNLDKAKELWLFECDDEWVEALRYTFEGYNNVKIINKYVSDTEEGNCVKLDYYCDSLKNEKVFVKMDIEGAEIRALQGGQKLLQSTGNIKLAVCSYHRQSDYKILCQMLSGMKVVSSRGYLLPLFGKIVPPYFRVGVIRASKVSVK